MSIREIRPGQSIADAILAASPGDTIRLLPGIHREKPFLFRDGLTLQGEPGVILDLRGLSLDIRYPIRAGYNYNFFSAQAGILVTTPYGAKWGTTPRDITINDLEVRGAPNGVYVMWSRNLTLSNVALKGNGQGLFVSGNGQNYDLLLQDLDFAGNGTPASYRQHGAYVEALGVTWERCSFHDPMPGMLGSALKSRSGGEVIRDCRFGPHPGFLLDLCDPQESNYIQKDPRFAETLVEGCTLMQGPGVGTYILHFGDDGTDRDSYPQTPLKTPAKSRPHLTFRNNKVTSGPYPKSTQTVVCDLRRNETRALFDSNVFQFETGSAPSWCYKTGDLTLRGNTCNRQPNNFRRIAPPPQVQGTIISL